MKFGETIVIDQDSELAGLAVYKGDYFGDYKIYQHLTKCMDLMVDIKHKIVTIPHIGETASYEALNLDEDFNHTDLCIRAIKRAPYCDVEEFAFKNKGSREYMQEQLLESHNKRKESER